MATTDAWIDLIAQRPSAVTIRDGKISIDMSRETARRHTELAVASPWMLGREVDGKPAAVLVGRTGSLEVPLDGLLAPALHRVEDLGPEEKPRQPLAIGVTLRGMAPGQFMTVLWNERPIVNLRVSEKWERRTISIPHDAALTGENRLRLHFRKLGPLDDQLVSAAVAQVEIGTREAIKAGESDPTGYAVEPTTGGAVELDVTANTGLAFYMVPPRRARLRFDVKGRGSLVVQASTDEDHEKGRRPTEVHQEPLRETGSHAEVDLSGYAGEPTRVEIRVSGSSEEAGATFSALELVARRNIPVDRRSRDRRNLYVIALEGARPDDLLDPNRRPELSNVHAFAAESLIFDRAYALGAAAVPSHAALLSSVVPPVHLTVRGTYVAEGQTLLPEVLERAGFFTVGISANTDLNAERGLVQGIDDHRVLFKSPTQGNNAGGVADLLIEQLQTRPSPRFGYVTMSDPQAPYDPPAELLGDLEIRPEGAPVQNRTHTWVWRVRTGKVEPNEDSLRYVRRLYRGELQVIDAALGRFMAALEETGQDEDAIVVIVGIHGEEFYDHLGAGHGRTLYEESIRVPLLVRAPGLLQPARVSTPVDLLDLAPTLADLIGVDYPSEWQGRSMLGLIDDPHPPPRLVISHLGDGSRAGIVGDHKLILGPGRGRKAVRFYDLGADPREQGDGREGGGIAYRVVRTAMAWHLPEEQRWKRNRWGTGAALEPAFALDHGM